MEEKKKKKHDKKGIFRKEKTGCKAKRLPVDCFSSSFLLDLLPVQTLPPRFLSVDSCLMRYSKSSASDRSLDLRVKRKKSPSESICPLIFLLFLLPKESFGRLTCNYKARNHSMFHKSICVFTQFLSKASHESVGGTQVEKRNVFFVGFIEFSSKKQNSVTKIRVAKSQMRNKRNEDSFHADDCVHQCHQRKFVCLHTSCHMLLFPRL